MDYVLFGMGYGATLMLLGWALRTFGPERKYKDIDPEDIDLVVEQRRWVRFIQGLGGVIAIAGTSMVLFVFVTMLVNPDDETGAFTALVIWGFLTVAVLAWCIFYVATYGLLGIWSKRDGYGFRGTSYATPTRQPAAGPSSSRLVVEQAPPDVSVEAAGPEEVLADTEVEIDVDMSVVDELIGPELIDDESEVVATVVPEEPIETEPDPEYDFGDSTDTTVPSEIGGRSEAVARLRERQAKHGSSSNT